MRSAVEQWRRTWVTLLSVMATAAVTRAPQSIAEQAVWWQIDGGLRRLHRKMLIECSHSAIGTRPLSEPRQLLVLRLFASFGQTCLVLRDTS